jgi:hypothetical protein
MSESVGVTARHRRSSAEAERIVLEYEQSGLKRQEFCSQHGLPVAALDKYRCRHAASPQVRGRLVPVELIPDRASVLETHSAFWVELSSGRRIEVRRGFDEATLERLISLLDKA